jgi:hypothetical protein
LARYRVEGLFSKIVLEGFRSHRSAGADRSGVFKEATMRNEHLHLISQEDQHSVQADVPRRVAVLALIIAAVVLLGAAAGGMFPSRAGGEASSGETAMAEPAHEFVYFPSQYVNQATEIEEHIEAF